MNNKNFFLLAVPFFIIVSCAVVCFIVNNKNNVITHEGTTISYKQMRKDSKVLARLEKIDGGITILNEFSDSDLSNKDYNEILEQLNIVENGGIVLSLSGKNNTINPFGGTGQLSKPIEIRYLASVFLYCRNRVLANEIVAYTLRFRPFAGVFHYLPEIKFQISNSEIEEIYLKYDINSQNTKRQIDELSKAIIKETRYRRVWSPNDKYLKGIEDAELEMLNLLRNELAADGISKSSRLVINVGGFSESYNAGYKEIFPIDKTPEINKNMRVLDAYYSRSLDVDDAVIRSIARTYLFMNIQTNKFNIAGYRFHFLLSVSSKAYAITVADIDKIYKEHNITQYEHEKQVDMLAELFNLYKK